MRTHSKATLQELQVSLAEAVKPVWCVRLQAVERHGWRVLRCFGVFVLVCVLQVAAICLIVGLHKQTLPCTYWAISGSASPTHTQDPGIIWAFAVCHSALAPGNALTACHILHLYIWLA